MLIMLKVIGLIDDECLSMKCTKGLFYDQGTPSVSFEVKNDVFQICLILMFLYCR